MNEMIVPDYLKQYEGQPTGREAVEGMDQAPRLQYLSVVQKMSETMEELGLGSVVLSPESSDGKPSILCTAGAPFHVTPLYCFPKFVLRRKKVTPGKTPQVAFSLSKNSQIARACLPRKRADRTIPDPSNAGEFLEYRTEYHYVMYVYEIEKCVMLTLSGGEEETHELWSKLITSRGNLPIYLGKYEASSGKHPLTYKHDQSWHGLNFKNAADPWSPQELIPEFKASMETFAQYVERSIAAEDAGNNTGTALVVHEDADLPF